jgi:murein endopeptidase
MEAMARAIALLVLVVLTLAAAPAAARLGERSPALPAVDDQIAYQPSRAIGLPWSGRLEQAVLLPEFGYDWFTWDPVLKTVPNREWRRWGTDRLVRTVVDVVTEYRLAHPAAPRVGIGDLSRPNGGNFGKRFGGRGHASHQNGLDVDVYYPRLDGLERRPARVEQVDRALAQDLVDRFVAAGAEKVFVGPRVGLHGPRRIVSALVFHDDHLHVRLRRR